MPVGYVQTGERRWGEAIIPLLSDLHRAMSKEVARRDWTKQSIDKPSFLPPERLLQNQEVAVVRHQALGLSTDCGRWVRIILPVPGTLLAVYH